MIIHKCDRCGKAATQVGDNRNPFPKGWYKLIFGRYGNSVVYYVCDDCRKKLHIPDDPRDADKNVGERLLELIEELVSEQVEASIDP